VTRCCAKGATIREMATTPRPSRRWLEGRIEKKGFRPRYAAYAIIGFWIVAAVLFGVLQRLVEPETFKTVWLGIWWAIETITTVGYGDITPQSTPGKVIGAILMLGGLSLLSVVTGAITSAFISRKEAHRRAEDGDPAFERLDGIAAELTELRAAIERLQTSRPR
jgi:voltage-gated potassium channel